MDSLVTIENFNPIAMTAISEEDKQMLAEVSPHLKGVQLGMSKYQIDKWVLSNQEFPTPDSKYWQSSRETFSRLNSVIQMQYELNKLSMDVEEIDIDLGKSEENSLSWRRLKNERDFKVLQMNLQKINLEDTLRQMRAFRDNLKKYDSQREFKTFEEAQEPYWKAKNFQMAMQQGNMFNQKRQ